MLWSPKIDKLKSTPDWLADRSGERLTDDPFPPGKNTQTSNLEIQLEAKKFNLKFATGVTRC